MINRTILIEYLVDCEGYREEELTLIPTPKLRQEYVRDEQELKQYAHTAQTADLILEVA